MDTTAPGLTYTVLLPDQEPSGRWCKSGHAAALKFASDGQVLPNRFLRVSGPALDSRFQGVYCEECIAVANRMAAQKKKLGL